jgi:hypothetical protein
VPESLKSAKWPFWLVHDFYSATAVLRAGGN